MVPIKIHFDGAIKILFGGASVIVVGHLLTTLFLLDKYSCLPFFVATLKGAVSVLYDGDSSEDSIHSRERTYLSDRCLAVKETSYPLRYTSGILETSWGPRNANLQNTLLQTFFAERKNGVA